MAKVVLKSVKKVFPGDIVAVQDCTLDIKDKEFVVLVGPSGCGKSTTLRMVAGLEEISEGEIYIGDRLVNNVPPKNRDIAMVFQNYALYPHMNVYRNMAFGLQLRKFPREEIDQMVR
jgi:multiple sugar transport system ATP-binding protein